MPRRKRNRQQQNQQPQVKTTFTKDEILDLVDDSTLENIIVVGVDKNGSMGVYSTIMTPGFMHHMLNDASFFISSMSLNSNAQKQVEAQKAEEVESSE